MRLVLRLQDDGVRKSCAGVCTDICGVDYASRESEETTVHIGTTIHCNNWIAKLAKAYCIHLSTHGSLQSACGYHC